VDRHANKQTHVFGQNDFNKQGAHPHNPAPSLKNLQEYAVIAVIILGYKV